MNIGFNLPESFVTDPSRSFIPACRLFLRKKAVRDHDPGRSENKKLKNCFHFFQFKVKYYASGFNNYYQKNKSCQVEIVLD